MTRKKSEDAVSPVIGVMLMLVVVIIVAAVITVFATGTVGSTEPAPIAKLDVEIIHDQPIGGSDSNANWHTGTAPTLHLTHVSGDPLDTADLKLSFSWKCSTHGTHTSTYQYTGDNTFGDGYISTGNGAVRPFGKGVDEIYAPAGYGPYVQPLYINYGIGNNDDIEGAYFGNHILKRGETMMAFDLHLYVPADGTKNAGNPAMDAIFNNGDVKSKMVSSDEPTAPPCPKCGAMLDVQQGDMICQICFAELYEEYGEAWEVSQLDEFIYHCPCGAKPGDFDESFSTFQDGKCVVCKKSALIIGDLGYTAGIMACLPEGTAVDVMITHIPSGKAIYEERVFVE